MDNGRTMRVILIVVFIFSLHIGVFAKSNGHLRSVIVADTQDVNIGSSCASDSYRLKKSLRAISAQMRLKADITVLDKRKCRCADLEKWVRSLRSAKTDVVMIFYAGHGHEDRSGSSLPVLILRDGEIRGATLQKVIERLPCRLSFLLFDCCNLLPQGIKSHFYPIIHKNRRLDPLKPLFQTSRASITVCAAEMGEFAWGGRTGGYLTTGFLLAMKDPDTSPSWSGILTKARRYSIRRSHNEQHPFFTVKTR